VHQRPITTQTGGKKSFICIQHYHSIIR